MKKLLLFCLLSVTGIYAQTDELTFTAQIQNRNSDTLMIRSRAMQHIITADAKGNFKDTFAVTPGLYQLYDGKEYTILYLTNNYDLVMRTDASEFDEAISYTGKGAAENNYLAKKMHADKTFVRELDDISGEDGAAAKLAADRDRELRAALDNPEMDKEFKTFMATTLDQEKKQVEAMAKRAQEAQRMKGKPSPAFSFKNHKGGTTNLSDFKGKYVYIDVWATWCGPCRKEIPHLQEMEEKYKGKNIAFVSISIDKQKDYSKWEKFVNDEALGGVQLIADNDWKSGFITAYEIKSIPRFILIDPKGKIVRSDAPRPSDSNIHYLLDKLLK